MADPIAVAEKRARAEQRLAAAVAAASRATDVPYTPPASPANRYPALYAAELVEQVATFIEGITAQQGQRKEVSK
jgi:hypothetical protein